MKKKHKISFLMAAHNEERIILPALLRLIKVHKDYPNMEVLIGLDGCTDGTTELVKKFAEKNKFFKVFELNERKGKQAVIEKLEPHVRGDIVIIHDADWSFVYKNKKDLLDFLDLFDNEKIGGIADSIDTEMSKPNFGQIKSLGFLASAWGNHLLTKYLKENFTKKVKDSDLLFYQKHKIKFYPFLDVYRKKAMDLSKHKSELRAGDHVERTLRIFDADYEIITFNNKNWPHFNVTYNKQSIKDLVKQKIRGIVAKDKIQSAYKFKIPFFGFHIPFSLYVMRNSFSRKRLRDFLAVYIYLFVMLYAVIFSRFQKKVSVKKVWEMRVGR